MVSGDHGPGFSECAAALAEIGLVFSDLASRRTGLHADHTLPVLDIVETWRLGGSTQAGRRSFCMAATDAAQYLPEEWVRAAYDPWEAWLRALFVLVPEAIDHSRSHSGMTETIDNAPEASVALVRRLRLRLLQAEADASESDADVAPGGKKTRKRKGPPQHNVPAEDARVARKWREAREAGQSKKEYCLQAGMSLGALNRTLDRVRHRKKPTE